MGVIVFLYLGGALVLCNSFTQVKEDGQRVVRLLQDLDFMLSLKKSQLEPTLEFAHLGFVLYTQAWAAKVASSPSCRSVTRLLGLTNFASVALLLARLHSCPLQFWLKENYKTPANLFKGLKPYSEAVQHKRQLTFHTFLISIYNRCIIPMFTPFKLQDNWIFRYPPSKKYNRKTVLAHHKVSSSPKSI